MAKASKTVELKVGDKLPLCVFHDRIISQANIEVVKVTEKAVQLKAENGWTLWFPRKAVIRKGGEDFITLQQWFTFDSFGNKWWEANCYWGACI